MGSSGWSQQDSNASFRMFLPLEPGESPFPVHPQTRGLEDRLIKQEITEIPKEVFAGAGLGSEGVKSGFYKNGWKKGLISAS
jgi:hypothetical protein